MRAVAKDCRADEHHQICFSEFGRTGAEQCAETWDPSKHRYALLHLPQLVDGHPDGAGPDARFRHGQRGRKELDAERKYRSVYRTGATGGDTPLSYTASGLPAGVTMSSARRVSGTPTASGSGTVTVTVTDNDADTDTLTFTWIVTAPTTAGNLEVSQNPSTPGSYTVSHASPPALPADTVTNALQYLNTYNLVETPSGGTAQSHALGRGPVSKSFTGKSSGTYAYQLQTCVDTYDFDGSDFVHRSRVCTDSGSSLSVTVDRGPDYSGVTVAAQSWPRNQAIIAFTIPAADGDAPLTYSISGEPAGIGINAQTSELSGTPTANGSGIATVTVRDADGDTDTLTFTWTVEADTSPMFAVDTLPGRTWAEDAATTAFTVPAATGGNVPLTYRLSGEPADIVIDPQTREVSGTPTAPGSGTATVTVRDNDGDTDTLTFTWTVVTPPSVPGRPTGPDTDVDGAYAIAWSASIGAARYELQESLDGGTWSSVSTTGTSTTKSFIGKASGEYLYRVRACNASVCSDWSSLKILFVNLPPTVGFDSTYVVRTGDLGSDGDTDIYLSPLATGTGNVGEFILENDSGTFSLDTSPTVTELAAAQSWTVSTQLPIMLEDVNVDGVWDAYVTGITASSAFGDAVDQIVVSPRTASGAPTGLVAVDADLIDFFESVMAWYEDFGHFDRRVLVGSQIFHGYTTGVFGPDILADCAALWGRCEVRANVQLAQHFGSAANCVAELAYRGIVPRDEQGNVASRWDACNLVVFVIFGVARSEVTVKDFSSVPAGAVENVARLIAIAETGELAYEVEDRADVLEVLVLGGATIVGDQIEERAEEVHQALLNIWAILARRIFPGERVDPESDVVRESDTVYVTRRRVRLVFPIGFTDSQWHLALEYTYPGAAASFLSNLTIAAYEDDGRLVARRNDPSERNNILTATVSSTRFLHNLRLWLALGTADRNYRRCPPFVVYDNPLDAMDDEDKYNSNGYINALVSFVNGAVASVTDEPFQFANYMQGDDPVPREEFLECQFQDIE